MRKEDKNDIQLKNVINKCQQMIDDNEDRNTIIQQISKIAYNDCIYRSFNEGLRLDNKNNNRPAVLVDQFHEYFFNNQAICIRKIFDSGDDVYSLRKIYDLIVRNKHIFTRRGYIIANEHQILKLPNKKMQDVQLEYLNSMYDLISNTNPDERNENDRLYDMYLDSIGQYLNRKKLLHEYTNTYIAHPTNQKRRKLTKQQLAKITLNNMQRSYIDISWLSYSLSRYVGDLILFEVPTPNYNQFQGWVGSIFKSNINKSLMTYWSKRVNLFEIWKRKYWFSDCIYLTPYKKANK